MERGRKMRLMAPSEDRSRVERISSVGLVIGCAVLLLGRFSAIAQEEFPFPDGSKAISFSTKEGKPRFLVEEARLRFQPADFAQLGIEILLNRHEIDQLPKNELPLFENDRYLRKMDLDDLQLEKIKQYKGEFLAEVKQLYKKNVTLVIGVTKESEEEIKQKLAEELHRSQKEAFKLLLPHQQQELELTLFQNEFRRTRDSVLLTGAAKAKLELTEDQRKDLKQLLDTSEKSMATAEEEAYKTIDDLKQAAQERIMSGLDSTQKAFVEQNLRK